MTIIDETLIRLNMMQTLFGKDIAFSVRTFRFTSGQTSSNQEQIINCQLYLEPAAEASTEQAADCTCYTEDECTGLFRGNGYRLIDSKTYLVPEFTEWSDWSACSVTCDGGERTRSRTCTAGCSNIDENDSDHSLLQSEVCNQTACGKSLFQSDNSCNIVTRMRISTCQSSHHGSKSTSRWKPANDGNVPSSIRHVPSRRPIEPMADNLSRQQWSSILLKRYLSMW